jgi:hypothetical protein
MVRRIVWHSSLTFERGGQTMNKKQKLLTAITLAVFAGFIVVNYSEPHGKSGFFPSDDGWYYLDLSFGEIAFVLAVFFVGLFFILGGKRAPRD